jgi:hypothetical protein
MLEARKFHQGVSLFAVLPHTRDSSGRQTVTSEVSAATVAVRRNSVKCSSQVFNDYPWSYNPEKPLTRKNTPNTKHSTTVIVRLFFSIHACSDTSMFEARCGTAV